jgi:hypothetical protein
VIEMANQAKPVICPNCGNKVPVSYLNLQEMVAACPSCDHVFNFSSIVGQLQPITDKRKFRKAKQPERITIDETNGLTMEYTIRSEKSTFWGWVLASLAFLLPTIFFAIGIGGEEPVMLVIGFISLLLVSYPFLAHFTNKGKIQLTDEKLSFASLPIPVFNSKEFDATKIIDVVAERDVNYDSMVESNMVAEHYFNIFVIQEDGLRRKFMGAVPESMANFIAQTLKTSLFETQYDDNMVDTQRLEEDSEPVSDLKEYDEEKSSNLRDLL